jgi:hypothetical protein
MTEPPQPMRILPTAITLLALISSASAQDLSGCYEKRGGRTGSNGEFQAGEALVLHQKNELEMEFHASVVGGNGHVCTAHGIAQRTSRAEKVYRHVVEKCTIEVSATSLRVVLSATSPCEEVFACGARAYVGVDLPRKSRKALGKGDCFMLPG